MRVKARIAANDTLDSSPTPTKLLLAIMFHGCPLLHAWKQQQEWVASLDFAVLDSCTLSSGETASHRKAMPAMRKKRGWLSLLHHVQFGFSLPTPMWLQHASRPAASRNAQLVLHLLSVAVGLWKSFSPTSDMENILPSLVGWLDVQENRGPLYL